MTSRVKLFIAIPVLLASATWLYLTFNPISPRPDVRPLNALGLVMAQQAATLAVGGKIYVIAPDPKVYRTPAAKAQLDSFMKAARAANMSIAATNLVKIDALRLLRMPAADFLSLSRRLTEKDVVVSFMGPPLLRPEQRAQMRNLPKIIAACTGDMGRQLPLRRAFENGFLHVAIISNPNAPAVVPGTGDLFNRYFQVVTERNLVDLPEPAEGVESLF